MMGTITTLGLDIAKSVFQVHGIDAAGEVIVRRQLSRARVLSFFETAALSNRDRGMQHIPLLGA
jgi:transposase